MANNMNIIHLEINGEVRGFSMPVIFKDIESLKELLNKKIELLELLELMEETYIE